MRRAVTAVEAEAARLGPHTYEDIETVASGLGVERIVVMLPQR